MDSTCFPSSSSCSLPAADALRIIAHFLSLTDILSFAVLCKHTISSLSNPLSFKHVHIEVLEEQGKGLYIVNATEQQPKLHFPLHKVHHSLITSYSTTITFRSIILLSTLLDILCQHFPLANRVCVLDCSFSSDSPLLPPSILFVEAREHYPSSSHLKLLEFSEPYFITDAPPLVILPQLMGLSLSTSDEDDGIMLDVCQFPSLRYIRINGCLLRLHPSQYSVFASLLFLQIKLLHFSTDEVSLLHQHRQTLLGVELSFYTIPTTPLSPFLCSIFMDPEKPFPSLRYLNISPLSQPYYCHGSAREREVKRKIHEYILTHKQEYYPQLKYYGGENTDLIFPSMKILSEEITRKTNEEEFTGIMDKIIQENIYSLNTDEVLKLNDSTMNVLQILEYVKVKSF